jgi:hypothetical protein
MAVQLGAGPIHGPRMVRTGFPQGFIRVLKVLKAAGAGVGIVFHDVEPYPVDA